MHGEQHGGILCGPNVVEYVGVEYNELTRGKLVVRSGRGHAELALEHVDRNQAGSAVLVELPTGLKGEQDLGDLRSMKQSYLSMTLPRGMFLGLEFLESLKQGEDVGVAGEPLGRRST